MGQDQVHGNFQALLGCLQAVSADPARQKVLRDKGWTTKEGHWNYQRWDAESQALLIDEDKSPVPQQELIGLVAQIAELVLARDVIHRFNADTSHITREGRNINLHVGGGITSTGNGNHMEPSGKADQPGSSSGDRATNSRREIAQGRIGQRGLCLSLVLLLHEGS